MSASRSAWRLGLILVCLSVAVKFEPRQFVVRAEQEIEGSPESASVTDEEVRPNRSVDYEEIAPKTKELPRQNDRDGQHGRVPTIQSGQTTRILTDGDVDDNFWYRVLGDDFKQAIHLQIDGDKPQSVYNVSSRYNLEQAYEPDIQREFYPNAEARQRYSPALAAPSSAPLPLPPPPHAIRVEQPSSVGIATPVLDASSLPSSPSYPAPAPAAANSIHKGVENQTNNDASESQQPSGKPNAQNNIVYNQRNSAPLAEVMRNYKPVVHRPTVQSKPSRGAYTEPSPAYEHSFEQIFAVDDGGLRVLQPRLPYTPSVGPTHGFAAEANKIHKHAKVDSAKSFMSSKRRHSMSKIPEKTITVNLPVKHDVVEIDDNEEPVVVRMPPIIYHGRQALPSTATYQQRYHHSHHHNHWQDTNPYVRDVPSSTKMTTTTTTTTPATTTTTTTTTPYIDAKPVEIEQLIYNKYHNNKISKAKIKTQIQQQQQLHKESQHAHKVTPGNTLATKLPPPSSQHDTPKTHKNARPPTTTSTPTLGTITSTLETTNSPTSRQPPLTEAPSLDTLSTITTTTTTTTTTTSRPRPVPLRSTSSSSTSTTTTTAATTSPQSIQTTIAESSSSPPTVHWSAFSPMTLPPAEELLHAAVNTDSDESNAKELLEK